MGDPGRALGLHIAIAAFAGFTCTLVWSLTGGYFWPVWAWLGLAITVALHAVTVHAIRATGDPVAAFRVKVELCVVIAAICFAVWALTGGGYLWPVWPVIGMSVVLGVRALFLFRNRLPWVREQALVERVDQLTRTRRGALDVQDSELRRIERDLHDGAQARLVALSMQLGRAEARLEGQPELADLVRQARGEASAAIAELRDLARGIAPPVLVARGLEAAVDALGRRAMTAVTVEAQIDRRPPAVIETAAYFVVAEALTNVAKHAPDATAHVALALDDERLLIEVSDDGPGGADPHGGGLTGLRHRVEALDGTLLRHQPRGRADHDPGGAAMRVVIAEDQALLREGLVALLRENDVDVVAQVDDGPGLLRVIGGHKPDLAIVDVRLPPTFTDEGVRAAIEARERHPDVGILILSQYIEPVYTGELLATGEGGIGYLLKERVGDIPAFLDALRRVAAGGTALDREVVAELMRSRSREAAGPLAALSPRENEVLGLMAEGRTNAAIARALVVTPGAVEKHISNIFSKLDLAATDDDHRRVLAVVTFLRATG